MADAARGVRQLVLVHGRDGARRVVEPEIRPLVDISAAVLGDDSGRSGYSYSGLCLTSLPHRRLADDQAWERTVGPVTLVIEPGRLKLGAGPATLVGVPFGARARMILIYLQTQAVLTDSRDISLGRSMRDWANRMGLSVGGETAATLREQARRIAACSMKFFWQHKEIGPGETASGTGVENARIIKRGLFFHDRSSSDDRQSSLFEDRVQLDQDFFDSLRRHPVPLRDAAIRQLKDSSAALDIYVWLAYRLHHLDKRVPIGWRELHAQFGMGYRHIRQFRPKFLDALAAAVAAYPEAQVTVEDSHIVLHPSPPPVPKLRAGG